MKIMYTSRPYQTDVKHDLYNAWNAGLNNNLIVMPTGSGKTGLASDVFREHKGAAVAIAHRQELVSQISLALAQQGIYHNLIASRSTVRFISTYHTHEIGRSYFHPQAPIAVAGVDTLIKRDLGSWRHQVTLWMQDEAHHVLMKANGDVPNKWGKATLLFPNARGFGLTASPRRADGKGLSRDNHGLFDSLIEGPTMRQLIDAGYLTDYRIFAPPSDLDLSQVATSSATGDFNASQLRTASHKSRIVGDVVTHYLRFAAGKLGITFAVDVETATDIASQYRALGIPAEVVSAKTPDRLRVELINHFRRRELLQLVNVDLFGEGFDLPAIEVVSMARPTQSYALYIQQFGRALRPLEGKDKAIIIDHVGNVVRHNGPPDIPQNWTLDARERGNRGKRDESIMPVTACENCMSIYERHLVACPYCGHRPEPQGRARPEQVDGNLLELTPEALRQLRGDVATVRLSPAALESRMTFANAPIVAIRSAVKNRTENYDAIIQRQDELTEAINWWGAFQEMRGDSREEAYKRFSFKFGMDVLTAQTMVRNDADELTKRILSDVER